MDRFEFARASRTVSLLGFLSIILTIFLFTSFSVLYYLDTSLGEDFKQEEDLQKLTIETEGKKVLYVVLSSASGMDLDLTLEIHSEEGDQIYERNLSTPVSEFISLDDGGEYHMLINMTHGDFEDMSVSITSIGLSTVLLPIGWLMMLPITFVLLLCGLSMGIFSAYRRVKGGLLQKTTGADED